MSKRLVVANWKMNPQTLKEAESVFLGVAKSIKKVRNCEIVVCAPFSFISVLKAKNKRKILLGAQNVSSYGEGAYTGEVSAKMLKSLSVDYVIVGHSERRAMGETNELISHKIFHAIKNGLTPILCIGEKSRDQDGEYLSFIKNQLVECLKDFPKPQIKNIIVAYEPVWAVGKDAVREATPSEFIEVSIFIRKVISDLYDSKVAHSVKIIYGGSVHRENVESFISQGQSSGFLIGRDSLNIKKFGEIINIIEKTK